MKLKALFSLALLLAIGCASMKVQSDFDRSADFLGWSSYSWVDREHTAPDDTDKLIRTEVERRLAARGYFKTSPRGVPDFLITYSGGLQDRFDAQSKGYAYWRGYPVGTDVTVTRYNQGTLTIDVIDVQNGTVVWQGWATGAADEAGRNQDLIREAIAKILETFPPQ